VQFPAGHEFAGDSSCGGKEGARQSRLAAMAAPISPGWGCTIT
jgi:hypothetical protein